jgi:hypothetical protein
MASFFEIPLSGSTPQTFTIQLAGNPLQLTFLYRNADPAIAGGCGWTVDVVNAQGANVLCGVPLVTGADLLAQYAYLNFNGSLFVRSDGTPEAIPTFENLGETPGGHLYWMIP